MDYYKEYPIRCPSCNELIATYSDDFEALIAAGSTIEEALNALGITCYISRIKMYNPTIVYFNMENRDVIEGRRNVDAVDDKEYIFDPTQNPANSVFVTCRSNFNNPSNITPMANRLTAPLGYETKTLNLVPGYPQSLTLNPEIPTETTLPAVDDIAYIGEVKDNLPIGEGINVTATDATAYVRPTQVGVPTINPDPTFVQPTIYVGRNAQVRVLGGRTYLAR